MATVTIVYWRDIPAQVIVRQGRRAAKVQLSERFERAIDRAAMRGGARDMDAYLAEWWRSEPEPCGDDLEAVAADRAERIEQAYSDERLKSLVDAHGHEPEPPAADPVEA
ncbi:MAG: virulence factor [Kiloniellales bacterium]